MANSQEQYLLFFFFVNHQSLIISIQYIKNYTIILVYMVNKMYMWTNL